MQKPPTERSWRKYIMRHVAPRHGEANLWARFYSGFVREEQKNVSLAVGGLSGNVSPELRNFPACDTNGAGSSPYFMRNLVLVYVLVCTFGIPATSARVRQ